MICRRGVVHLVGAGPGDPDLITVRGLKLIRSADCVIHDRLIPHELLRECREDAEVIDVGKYPDHHRVSQEEINVLLVERALQGNIVVRLKGGDPFVFGRGTEEMEACQAAEIPCFVVPGISSAIAAPSSIGIPVTSRGVARSFTVVTGQTDPNLGTYDLDFEALAKSDTVVFLMGRRNLAELVAALLAAGKPRDLPVACIERATMPDQRATLATLSTIVAQVEALGLTSPMVTVVGEVAAFAAKDVLESVATTGALSQRPSPSSPLAAVSIV